MRINISFVSICQKSELSDAKITVQCPIINYLVDLSVFELLGYLSNMSILGSLIADAHENSYQL